MASGCCWGVQPFRYLDVLMDNRMHPLVSVDDVASSARAMRLLNQRYAGPFNYTYGGTGPLWESRFKSCLIGSDSYLLHAYR